MASIEVNGDHLRLSFAWKGVHCREALDLEDTPEGHVRAKAIKLQVEAEIARGDLDFLKWFPKSKKARTIFAPPPPPPTPPAPAAPPTFADFARTWLEREWGKGRWKRAHYLDNKSLLEAHLIGYFREQRPVTQFGVPDIEDFLINIQKLETGLKAKTIGPTRVNKARGLLRRILGRAVKAGWLTVNPVLDEDVRPLPEDDTDVDPFSWEELRRLLDKGFPHEPKWRRYYTVAFFTGLRPAEEIGLHWADLDWVHVPPRATIVRSVTRADGAHATKTKGSKRSIDLRPEAAQAIKAQQAESRLRSDYVFCNAEGGPLNRDNLARRVWYPALQRAGVRLRPPYQTRHTFAVLAILANEPLGWVAHQLGHRNLDMINRHYFKHLPNSRDGIGFDQMAARYGFGR